MTALLIVLGWLACAIGAAGFNFAYMQASFPSIAFRSRREDLGSALLLGLMAGPLSLVVIFFLSGLGEHGWRLR